MLSTISRKIQTLYLNEQRTFQSTVFWVYHLNVLIYSSVAGDREQRSNGRGIAYIKNN